VTQAGKAGTANRSVTAPTLGALGLFFVVTILLLTSGKGTQDYRTGQNALFAFTIIFSVLFVTRLVWLSKVGVPLSLADRERWNAYATSGALAIDASFVVSALVFLLLADLSSWKDYKVRIGTVAAIVIVRLVVSVVSGLRRRR